MKKIYFLDNIQKSVISDQKIALEVEKIDNNLNIPIIICSAYTEKYDEIDKLGIECFLSKPVDSCLLKKYISKYITL